MRTYHLAAALLLAAGPLAAGDAVVIRDVRLALGLVMGGSKTEGDYHSSTVLAGDSTDRDSDMHSRTSISFVGAYAEPGLGGPLVGLGVVSDSAKSSGYNAAWGEEIAQQWSGYIFEAQAGWAYAFDRRFHVEGAAMLGVGIGTVELSGIEGYAFDPGEAWVYEYGLRFGAYCTIRQAQFGIETGYVFTRYQNAVWELKGDPLTVYEEDSLLGGLHLGMTLGVRF